MASICKAGNDSPCAIDHEPSALGLPEFVSYLGTIFYKNQSITRFVELSCDIPVTPGKINE
jgi:hypothetical protein